LVIGLGKIFIRIVICYNIDSNNNSDKYNFNGIIASIRLKNIKNIKYAMILLGIDSQKYIQLNILDFITNSSKFIGIKGIGYYKSENDKLLNIITCEKYKIW
jgi:hypothetical protein